MKYVKKENNKEILYIQNKDINFIINYSYMPKYIKKQISFADVDSKKNTMNDIYDVILLDVFDDPLIRKYAKEIYNIKLDIDADYSQYIITFELK